MKVKPKVCKAVSKHSEESRTKNGRRIADRRGPEKSHCFEDKRGGGRWAR